MNKNEVVIIGKNESIISMILDCFESNLFFPKVSIYNNLNLKIENDFINTNFEMFLTNKITSLENSFISLNKKDSIHNIISELNIDINKLMTVIHKNSYISTTTKVGNNCLISSLVSIAGHSKIGNFVRINRNCSVGHHVNINNNVNLNPGVNIAGYVDIDENTTIGMGSNVLNKIKIGKNSIIGAGSVVTKDIPDGVIAYGSPCKIIRENIY